MKTELMQLLRQFSSCFLLVALLRIFPRLLFHGTQLTRTQSRSFILLLYYFEIDKNNYKPGPDFSFAILFVFPDSLIQTLIAAKTNKSYNMFLTCGLIDSNCEISFLVARSNNHFQTVHINGSHSTEHTRFDSHRR